MPVNTKKPAVKATEKRGAANGRLTARPNVVNAQAMVLKKVATTPRAKPNPALNSGSSRSIEQAPDSELGQPIKWRAEESTWVELRADRYKRAWVLAALSIGARPLKNISKLLKDAGRTEELQAFLAAKSAAKNNLTSANDHTRLQYVTDADNDGRLRNSSAKSTERMVDVVRFVKFMDSRGIAVHERMRAIAKEIDEPQFSGNQILSSGSAAPSVEPQIASREMLAMALLMMYVKHLAVTQTAPPPKLLKGTGTSKLNLLELASAIHHFAEGRTDLITPHALHSTGASPETLRKGLASAKKYFNDTFID